MNCRVAVIAKTLHGDDERVRRRIDAEAGGEPAHEGDAFASGGDITIEGPDLRTEVDVCVAARRVEVAAAARDGAGTKDAEGRVDKHLDEFAHPIRCGPSVEATGKGRLGTVAVEDIVAEDEERGVDGGIEPLKIDLYDYQLSDIKPIPYGKQVAKLDGIHTRRVSNEMVPGPRRCKPLGSAVGNWPDECLHSMTNGDDGTGRKVCEDVLKADFENSLRQLDLVECAATEQSLARHVAEAPCVDLVGHRFNGVFRPGARPRRPRGGCEWELRVGVDASVIVVTEADVVVHVLRGVRQRATLLVVAMDG